MVIFVVQDMSCSHCANAITRAVQELDASADVLVDLDTKRVTLNAHQVDVAVLAAAIAEAGYTPVAIPV